LSDSAFAQALVKKGERALTSAKANLREGDMDGAVNRAYYAMFNIARAALLGAGIPESELPRSHNGLIGAFGEQAVKVRRLDPELGRALNKTESLRLQADYTGLQIDRPTAEGAVARAEVFVRTVEREFGLEGMAAQTDLSPDGSKTIDEEKQEGSVRDHTSETSAASHPWSLEETQRRAAEDWRRNYYDKRAKDGPQVDSSHTGDHIDKKDVQSERDVGLDMDPEQ
jgi:uncharacterized protein (UPF0332 family)